MSVTIAEREHYTEVRFWGNRYVTKQLECNYCTYFTKREDYMLKHLEKEHGILASK